MTLREQLILVSDEFGRARGIGRQRVSTIVLNRGSTLDLLAQSRSDLNTGTFERAMLWFSENWPEGAEWPAGVSRPLVSEAAE
ncbi:hypothetical protein [Sinorhizobium meliloti]|jgi:hypothetical protein|uniref:hypothetical protein n=1 Tax=Rhizobium meliloti TaxID=382 RepID=UPI000FD98935|nr:hypothetical protein [Sinorhizobium meliloti]RVE90097.1 hypothetical protein CN238_11840 [Sinorhizobium meliloti]RVH30512.1 hypothetical protein CN214_13620 [Sinorhizobium meliloti]